VVSSEQRRKQLARDKYLRQQQRRAETRRKSRIRNASIAAGVAVVLVLCTAYAMSGGLSGGKEDTAGDSPSSTPTPTPTPTQQEEAPDPCDKPAEGEPNGKQWDKEPELTVEESATYTMTLETTCGEIGVEMDAAKAPHTVNSFAFLAQNDYFDHTKCHRMTAQGIYVLQCGDPKGSGMGGPGYSFADENLDSERIKGGVYPAGTVAMANSGPDTNGSQFFLVYKDSKLSADYTPFGTVSDSGMKVLKKIAGAGVQGPGKDGAPVATAVIDEATVEKS
jgi:peptidyl-prolyl cis-trans isomerase B (cyclophilin B)